MNPRDTICAVASPPGQGGIGLIRISGDRAIEMVDRLFRDGRRRSLVAVPSHTVHYGRLVSPRDAEGIDEVLVTVMRRPRSYTREDLVEIGLHGSPLNLQRAMEALVDVGARIAEPGEFTFRAFIHGRLDLVQAEAVMEMINARTMEGRRAALSQLEGSLSEKIRTLYHAIVDLLARIEAAIDFSEEDLGVDQPVEILQSLRNIRSRVETMLRDHRTGRLAREGIRTVIIGRPNVGKSSLLNRLLGEERAIVTPHPGTTRDLISEYVSLGGISLRLVDTAGLRPTEDPVEQEGVRRTVSAMDQANLLLLIFDGSACLDPEELSLPDRLPDVPVVILLNKADLPRRIPMPWIQQAFPGRPVLSLSALTGEGIPELKETLSKLFQNEVRPMAGTWVTLSRHTVLLQKTLEALDRAQTAGEEGLSGEFLSTDLQEARQKLGEILGLEAPDDVIQAIFSRFCIGK